jgi:hypothetical protein
MKSSLPSSKELVRNVKRWTAKLQEHHWQAGKAWYNHAHQLCRVLSNETEIPLKNVCGILAALSPQVSWDTNIASCEAIVRTGKIDKAYTGYKVNVEKAYLCLSVDPLEVLGGLKVLAFYHNILDPLKSDDVTVDTHIGRVLFDKMYLESNEVSYLFSKRGNLEAQEAIQRESKKHRVRPHVLQAALWVCVRELAQARADKDQLPLYIK